MFIGGILRANTLLVSPIPSDESYTTLKFNGEINVDNVCITSETYTEEQITEAAEQTWDSNNIKMLANYEDKLEAGNIENGDNPIDHWRVYRRRPTENLSTLLCEIPYDYDNTSFTDYTPRNLIEYIYTLYAVSNDTEGQGLEVTAMTNWYGWIISNDYDIELGATPTSYYTFDLDNKSGNIEVKRGYTIYENYTQYPAIRFDDRNFSKGSLTTLPYEWNNNEIDCSLDILEEIVTFLNNKETKIIRNSKGQWWRGVTIDASYQLKDEISYVVNGEQRDFPAEVVFSWCETGSE
jgi:hypothetical protein